jgi:hypothetical protein
MKNSALLLLAFVASTFTFDGGFAKKKCWSLAEGYPCCEKKGTKVRHVSKNGNEWGVEHGDWCGITDLQRCPDYGKYECCKSCKVKHISKSGNTWGVEDGKWCSIPYRCEKEEAEASATTAPAEATTATTTSPTPVVPAGPFKITSKDGKSNISFYCEDEEFSGVKKIADMVRNDVKLVTGALPEFNYSLNTTIGEEAAVIFGTVGKSNLFEGVDVSAIKDKYESYVFNVQGNRIYIAGSDKRGTIYGLFHLSELMGVSPFVDWLDLKPIKQETVEITEKDNVVSKEPSVRYRGLFINDEWPAFGNWANHNYGGFNAKMYVHVFELLLRLKGNYMWPAMWSGRFSDDGPGLANAELADELGVVMGSSHHEPCCRAGEEYKYLRGKDSIYGDAWNFRSNEKGITKFWEDGLKRNGKFDNVITVGMRGEADTAIAGDATLADNIQLLRDVLTTQNRLIKEYVNEDIMSVPRMLALYKEVEPYFYGDEETKGLMDDPILDGVTLMLCDDNHGNLRTVPSEAMRKHPGGYGMYYHFDYHGSPFSYEWINTNYLPKVQEQMTAAYDFGIRNIWIVNLGDVLTTEFPLSYFLDLAYDYEKYSTLDFNTFDYTKQWIGKQFASLTEEQRADIEFIFNNYNKLAFIRRTESVNSETYHPVNFGESEKILSLAEEVIDRAEKLKKEIDVKSDVYEAFFTQVYFAAKGTMNVLKLQLLSGKNHWYATHGMLAANPFVEKIKQCVKVDDDLVKELDELKDGRWYGMGWSEHIGFTRWNEEENLMPVYMTTDGARRTRIGAWVEGTSTVTSGQDWTKQTLKLDAFKNPDVKEAVINVAKCSKKEIKVSAEIIDGDFLSYEIKDGKDADVSKVVVTVDRKKLAKASEKKCTINITVPHDDVSGGNIVVVVDVDAEVPNVDYPKGTFVQTTSYISIEAEHFISQKNGTDSSWKVIEGYGKTLSAIKAYPVINVYNDVSEAPYVEYNFVLNEGGAMAFDFYQNPSNPAFMDNKLQFAIDINGKVIVHDVVDSKTFAVGDNKYPWSDDVTNEIRISTVNVECKSGLNSLKFYPITPNIVLEKIIIRPESLKMPESYLGAPETYYVN